MKCEQVSGVDISYQLKRLGWAQSVLAREFKVLPSLVNSVIHNRLIGYRVALKISKILNCDLHVLWPDRYTFKPRSTFEEERKH